MMLIERFDWDQFKQAIIRFDPDLKSIRYLEFDNEYLIWIEIRGRIFECEIPKETREAIDFETNFKIKVRPEFKDGLKLVGHSLPIIFGNPLWRGDEGDIDLKFEVIAGVENFFDIQITKFKALRGGRYVIINPEGIHQNDYLEFSIIDKENVLGLFDRYGVPKGGFLELTKFIKKWWVFLTPSYEFKSESYLKILPGLYLRIGYRSFGTVNIHLFGNLFWLENIS